VRESVRYRMIYHTDIFTYTLCDSGIERLTGQRDLERIIDRAAFVCRINEENWRGKGCSSLVFNVEEICDPLSRSSSITPIFVVNYLHTGNNYSVWHK